MPLDPSISLQPHQQRLRDKAEEAARTGTPFRTLGLWSTGSGKTLGALGAVDALGGNATYVVPAALRENLRGEAIRSIGKPPAVYSYQGAVAGKAPPTDTLVLDECLPAGSLIDARPIETIIIGDTVRSFNHRAGVVELRQVTRTANRQTREIAVVSLHSGCSIVCTPEHPVCTQRGYVPAYLLTSSDSVVKLSNTESLLVNEVDYARSQTLARCGNEVCRVRHTVYSTGLPQESSTQALLDGVPQESLGKRDEACVCALRGQNRGAHAHEQPDGGFETERTSSSKNYRLRARCSGRERERADQARIGDRASPELATSDGQHARLSERNQSPAEELQDRRRQHGDENSRRDRRPITQRPCTEGPGRQEDGILGVDRVDRVTVYQQGSGPEFDRLCPGGVVYDLTVDQNHNFFVDDFLVHNSQRITSPGSQQAAAVKDLASKSKNVIALSGTPIKNSPEEFAPLMSLLTNKDISHEQFKQRYIGKERTRPGGLLGWIRGEPAVERPVLQNTDELKELLKGKIDYYRSEQNPDGANVNYKDVETEMTRRQADLYEGFWNRLPFMMRWKLRHRYDLSPEELNRFKSFMTGPRQVGLSDLPFRTDGNALKAFDDSGKLTAAFKSMQETLADPRRKGIVYSNFPRAGLNPYAAALDRAKIPYGVFDGSLNDQQRRDMVKDFNDGKLRVALVGPAGSEGISLKGAQKLQILDEYWHQARSQQATARGIRFDSHKDLPEELRNVDVERYRARLPLHLKDRLLSMLGVATDDKTQTVDHHMRVIADRKQLLNQQFLDLLRRIGEGSDVLRAKSPA